VEHLFQRIKDRKKKKLYAFCCWGEKKRRNGKTQETNQGGTGKSPRVGLDLFDRWDPSRKDAKDEAGQG